ncbi:hypothetical protein B0H10DRAFT_1952360 [Mycena sp. CBHHK59/15]|nr:hypothetical protein B0H10DRAFT_1952360 [Mycena sp. CBHHK59/15]
MLRISLPCPGTTCADKAGGKKSRICDHRDGLDGRLQGSLELNRFLSEYGGREGRWEKQISPSQRSQALSFIWICVSWVWKPEEAAPDKIHGDTTAVGSGMRRRGSDAICRPRYLGTANEKDVFRVYLVAPGRATCAELEGPNGVRLPP